MLLLTSLSPPFIVCMLFRTTVIQDLIYLAGSLVLTLAFSTPALFCGRLIVGVASAFSAVATVPYLNEIAPIEYRGRLSSMFELMIVVGALLGTISSLIFLNTQYGWRIMFFIPSMLSTLQIFGMMRLPESPHWLVQQGKLDDAKAALSLIYANDEAEVRHALDHIIDLDSKSRVNSISEHSVSDVWAGLNEAHQQTSTKEEVLKYKLSFVVIIILMALGQLTGSVVIRNYAPTIFKDAGFSRVASLQFNAVVSFVNLAVVCGSTYNVYRYGRRVLLCVGFIVTAIGNAVLVFGFLTTNPHTTSTKDIITFLVGCTLTSAGFVLGFGPIGWVLSSELFSTQIRGRALSISTLSRNVFEFCTNFLFLLMIKSIHDYGTFSIFTVFCLISAVFSVVGLVETKEVESEEILFLLKNAPLWRCCFGGKRRRGDSKMNYQGLIAGEGLDSHRVPSSHVEYDDDHYSQPIYSPVRR
jgi:sugar porter (SP) family MFS transporter